MLRMPDPIHPDLPCLFAGDVVPALCSVAIPDACDHKPRAAWVYVRLLLHRCSAAGWAECVIYSALVSFF